MKTIQLGKLVFTCLALCLVLQVSAEKAESQYREVKNFSKISVSSGIDLYLTQGTSEKVRVVADPDLQNKIITEVSGNTLKIYIKNNNNWNWSWNKKREVYVTFSELTALHVSAGADVKSDGELKLDEIDISVSSGADLDLTALTAKAIHLSSSSGADASLSGESDFLSADSSSGSDIDCSKLMAREVKASASSGSDTEVYVTEKLVAAASSGGDISYHGDPSIRDINESSGGDVSSY